jgi:hypothetical protein
VEVYALDGHLVNRRFGFGQPLEELAGTSSGRRREGRAIDVPLDVLQVVVPMGAAVVLVPGVGRLRLAVVAVPVIVMRTFVLVRVLVLMVVRVRAIVIMAVGLPVIVGMVLRAVVGVTVGLSGLDEPELRGRDPGAQDAVGRDRPVVDRQAAEGPAELVERKAEIEQGAEHHVARHARKAVDVKRLAQRSPFSR